MGAPGKCMAEGDGVVFDVRAVGALDVMASGWAGESEGEGLPVAFGPGHLPS